MNSSQSPYHEGQEVELTVSTSTPLGYKALINDTDWGILYRNEVFQNLTYGQKIKGYIRKIREDGKIDLSLNSTGHKAADPIAPKIIELLKANKGFYKINDKTEAEEIYRLFGVSKKKFKIALGGLYKKRLIEVTDEGTRLI